MNYRINSKKNIFEVYETATEQVIKSFSDAKEAKKFMKSLNLGSGFDGWTPSFVLKDFSEYINKRRRNMKHA
jgi:hypothetical protein